MREYNLIDRLHYEPTNEALAAYVGHSVTRPTYSYPINSKYYTYYAKFYTPTPKAFADYNYIVVCSQKPITEITVVNNNTQGYYGITGNEGSLYSLYVSNDDIEYKLIETALCNDTSRQLIGTKHVLYGTTEDTYYVDGNYTIANAPTAPVHCTDIEVVSSLAVDKTATLEYTLVPSDTTDGVTITSADPTIIRVNNNTLTAISTGNTTVTITCGEVSKTIQVSATHDETTPTGYTLPASQDIAMFEGSKMLFSNDPTDTNAKYHYYSMVHDKVNDRYLLMYSSSPINNIKFTNNKLIYGNTVDMNFMVMWNDSPNYPDYYEYYNGDTDKCNYINGVANVRKSNNVAGKYMYFAADAENNIEALTSTDQIEVITANHDISGYYELSD